MMYKGYEIDTEMLPGLFTVLLGGDEVVFDTLQEAKHLIDLIT